jgi:NAD(P)-dependent dehydrogenase (short-subunit alcohol dehydrogenase family)
MDDLKHRSGVVCGGASGIGAAIADNLANFGMQVAVLDIVKSPRHNTYICDLTDWDHCCNTFDQIINDFGQIHSMVNSARIRNVALSNTHHPIEISALIKQEIDAFLFPLELACQHMALNQTGSIVQVSSILANQIALEVPLNYHCAKSVIKQLSKYYCCKFGPSGIRVNTVSPGLISDISRETFSQLKSATKYQHLASYLPSRSSGSPLDVANVVRFLLGEDAFFINGADIVIDGGENIQELLSKVLS